MNLKHVVLQISNLIIFIKTIIIVEDMNFEIFNITEIILWALIYKIMEYSWELSVI